MKGLVYDIDNNNLVSDKHMTKLSRILSYALHHNPSKYSLEVDEAGWTSIDNLLTTLSTQHYPRHDNNNKPYNNHNIITRQGYRKDNFLLR
jgi:RNA:NAD 2'-phosphotransferase (TPT1/KptA family)